ncbi:hypothetical protein MJD09_26170 [bacterium]|nr:hypothetical protein [bacterium]
MGNQSATAVGSHLRQFRLHGWFGVLVMVFGEILLVQDIDLVKRWFTPVMWSGYILFADALLLKLTGNSLIIDRFGAFLFMLPYSVVCWAIFEVYNLYLENWRYVGLPENALLRYFGYVWSFATIWPAVLLTYELIRFSGWFDKVRVPRFRFKPSTLYLICILGLSMLIVPVLVPQNVAAYLFGPVWMGFVFFLDPVNYFIGANSLFRELEEGKLDKLLSLFAAGLVCGVLWEFWNYWATAKWIYTFPYFQDIKLFEMPLIGFLGFLPFAVEIYVMWELAARVFKIKSVFDD